MRRLGILLVLGAVALASAGCGDDSSSAAKPQLAVSADASLRAIFTKYAKTFAEATPKFSFAGSAALAGKIRQGPKPDVFASANTTLPDALYKAGLVEEPIRFTANPASGVVYAIAVVKGAKQSLAAKAFVYGLLSGTGRDALDGARWGQPTADPRP